MIARKIGSYDMQNLIFFTNQVNANEQKNLNLKIETLRLKYEQCHMIRDSLYGFGFAIR